MPLPSTSPAKTTTGKGLDAGSESESDSDDVVGEVEEEEEEDEGQNLVTVCSVHWTQNVLDGRELTLYRRYRAPESRILLLSQLNLRRRFPQEGGYNWEFRPVEEKVFGGHGEVGECLL